MVQEAGECLLQPFPPSRCPLGEVGDLLWSVQSAGPWGVSLQLESGHGGDGDPVWMLGWEPGYDTVVGTCCRYENGDLV